MATIGMVATAIVAVVALGAVAVGVLSIPDIRRYFRIRHM
ncbi:DUF6893 family small protein [Nocardia tengchongensis]